MTITLDTTIQVADRNGTNTQPARIVAPGLAITPSLGTPGRYVLTHTESGKTVSYGNHCANHIEHAARVAAESGVDWTTPADQFDVAAGKRVAEQIWGTVGRCLTCPTGVTEPEPEPYTTPARHVRIVAGSRFTAAYEGDRLTAVKWQAGGVWYVSDGGNPRTFADESAATKAFLAAAEVSS